jgi:branched-chain amino acid transport system ATP-binding protein
MTAATSIQQTAVDAGRQPLLSVRGVKTYYGNIIALKGVDMGRP